MRANVQLHRLPTFIARLSHTVSCLFHFLDSCHSESLSVTSELDTRRAMSETWVVVGASRGIGLELVKQLLGEGKNVIAGVRNPSGATELSQWVARLSRPERCVVEQCDVTDEESIGVSSLHPPKIYTRNPMLISIK